MTRIIHIQEHIQGRVKMFAALAALGALLGIGGRLPLVREADAAPPQGVQVPKFEVDPTWPKPWKNNLWVTGEIGGTCIDAQDHVFLLNRGVLTGDEQRNSSQAPAVLELDTQGNLLNSWGDRKVLPNGGLHGCFVDNENNIWIASSGDGIIQKYTHDGSKLLLQIGTRGKIDAYDPSLAPVGYQKAVAPTNSSHTSLNDPACIFVDSNGDVYVADGYGNRRVVVFDKDGHYLRQWGRQATLDEAKQGVGGVFLDTVHCVVIDNAGLVYVADRKGDRIQVFDKMGNFKKNIWIQKGTGLDRGLPGSAWWLQFSRDPQQRYMYVVDGGNEKIWILDHNSGEILSGFGHAGHQPGGFSYLHTITVDSQGNIYTGETINGRRAQKFRMTGMGPAGNLPEVRTDIPGAAPAAGGAQIGPG